MSTRDNANLLANAAPMGQNQETIVPDNSVAIDIGTSAQQPTPPSSGNTRPQDNSNSMSSILKQSSHPSILIAHFAFRIAALVLYIFASILLPDFVLTFVLSVLCLAFDFWVVKNVSGRFLVGLRWWNEVDNFGTSQWFFEFRDYNVESNAIDSKLFWISLYATPVIWILLALIALIKFNFEWLLIVVVALALSGTNLIGYHKCERHAKEKSGSGASNGGGGMFGSLGSSSSMMGGFINRSVASLFG